MGRIARTPVRLVDHFAPGVCAVVSGASDHQRKRSGHKRATGSQDANDPLAFIAQIGDCGGIARYRSTPTGLAGVFGFSLVEGVSRVGRASV